MALSENMRKQRIDTVRLKLLKIAAKVVRSARYITFKLCSSCPYKSEFYETISNIDLMRLHFTKIHGRTCLHQDQVAATTVK